MDRTQFQMKLTGTAAQIALVERDLEAIGHPIDAVAGARANARKAALGLVELAALFNDGSEPVAAKVACLSCGKPGMAEASRCGFCWTKIVHTANG